MAFAPLGNSDHVAVLVSIDFPRNSKQGALFHCIAYNYSHANWGSLCDHLRDVSWEDIFKLSACITASEFCEWVQVEIDVYIPHGKYQVKLHSFSWFSAACATVIAQRNHFFHLYQQNKSSELKVKSRQTSNCCKRVLQAAKLAYATKTKESITSQKLGSLDFWQIANSFFNKDKSAYLLYLTDWRFCLLHLVKQSYLLKTFLRTLILMALVSLFTCFPRTNLKLHNISITPKMVNKVIMNLDSSKVSGSDCIPMMVLRNCEPELSCIYS